MTMRDCAITDNRAGRGNARFATEDGRGGGMFTHGPVTMIDCLVSGNATRGDATGGGFGGGIYSGNTLSMTNCMFSGNTADLAHARVGGIFNGGNALTLTNSTVTGNSAYTCCTFQSGQGIHTGGTARVRNTIIAGNGPRASQT